MAFYRSAGIKITSRADALARAARYRSALRLESQKVADGWLIMPDVFADLRLHHQETLAKGRTFSAPRLPG